MLAGRCTESHARFGVVDQVSHSAMQLMLAAGFQERLTSQIADLLMDELDAKGAGVILEATHTCMTIRGVKKPGAVMVTSSMLGSFRTNMATRTEAIKLLTQT